MEGKEICGRFIFQMILTDRRIKAAVTKDELVIHNYSESCIQPASYDMRVGNQGFTTTSREMIDVKGRGLMILEPGDFGVVTTYEEIELPISSISLSRHSWLSLIASLRIMR